MKSKKIIVLLLLIISIFNVCAIANASTVGVIVEIVEEREKELTYLYNTTFKDRMIKHNGKVVYNVNALNEQRVNLEIGETYKFENMQIANIIMEGYPYRTPEELNCKDEFEAYIATQEAIYIDYEPRDIETYVVKGESGERILEAAKKIVKNAKKVSSIDNIKITEKNEEFIEDSIDNTYLMKEYEIATSGIIESGTIELVAGLGIRITDLENKDKTNFAEKDEFKILVPKYNKEQNISVKFDAKFIKPELLSSVGTESNPNNGLVIVGHTIQNLSTHMDIKTGELSTIKVTNIAKDTRRTYQRK